MTAPSGRAGSGIDTSQIDTSQITTSDSSAQRSRPGLRDLAPPGLRIGSAVAVGPLLEDAAYREALAREFNAVTAENAMKWQSIEPERGVFDFAPAERIIEFAEANGMDVYGHVLVWHNQLPEWLRQGVDDGAITSTEFREIVREHVQTVAGHFKGRITAWDAVNEAIADDGGLRDSIFLQQMGPGYIGDVFRWAREADPNASLFINDYNVEWTAETGGDGGRYRRGRGYAHLVRRLADDGVPIDGVGVQCHLSVNGYTSEVSDPLDLGHMVHTLRSFADLGLRTAVTEVDVGMPMPPDSVQLHAQAYAYAATMLACLETPGCERYTTWGLTDRYNWIPGHRPGWGAAALFDRDYHPKPAYDALSALLRLSGSVRAAAVE